MRMVSLVALAAICVASPATADPVADFYAGKTIKMIISFSSGGDYDLRARMIAPYLSKYLPGHPSVVPENMVGGAGLKAANWLTNVAPHDGTSILGVSQGLAVTQAMKQAGVQYDVRKFNWLSNTTDSPNVINSWYTTGVTDIKQVMEKPLVVGATGRSSGSYYYPAALNAYAGTKFKIVTGYPGGNDVNLAMERGEVGGRGSNLWASWKSTRPQWIAENKIHILVQVGVKRNPELANVPLMQELVSDPKAKQVLRFLSLDTAIARAFVAAPGVPAERVAALRHAFEMALKDPALLAEAAKSKTDISPSSGKEAQEIATEIVDTQPEVVELAKKVLF